MKNALLFLICVGIGAANAHAALFNLFSPKWHATVKVVDEKGLPVSGAYVMIGYYVPPGPDESIAVAKKDGLSDTNGIFRASTRSRSPDLIFTAQKPGFYESHTSHELGFRYDPVRWSPTSTLVLKKIVQPIAMYAKKLNVDPPLNDKPVAYDFTVGDWVAPHGKGAHADILFTQYLTKRGEKDFDYKLVVSFPNSGDGIQPFTVSATERTSKLRSHHEAPDSGYRSEWVKTRSHHPGYPNSAGIDDNLNFFVRVRTVLDEHGM